MDENAIARLEEVFPDPEHQNRSIWKVYLPHVQFMLNSDAGKYSDCRNELEWRFAGCLLEDGRYNNAEKFLLEIYETDKKVLGQELFRKAHKHE